MKYLLMLIIPLILIISCSKKEDEKMNFIDSPTIKKVVDSLGRKYKDLDEARLARSLKQAASFWKEEDGSKKDFYEFCVTNFVNDPTELDKVFMRLSKNYESLFGHFNKITLDLKWYSDVQDGEQMPMDEMFAGYDPSANMTNDFFKNKIAFYTILNFPFFTLEEKQDMGKSWSRKQWAYARMGDLFTARVPSELLLESAAISAKADGYIANYNIYAGNLVDDNMKTFFPKDMKLISHWNLRDEIKSQYANQDGLNKQKMIYEVMNRIISQDFPKEVINNPDYQWNPVKNILYKDGKKTGFESEPNTRYQMLLDNFKSKVKIDKYSPGYPTYIARKFDMEMEITQKDVEALFVKLCSSTTVKKVAELIQKRLGRKLEPWDIWYDGFKSRSTISADQLNGMTRSKYPTSDEFAKEMPVILKKLGFSSEKADWISSKVQVDPSRGAGHAWGAQMRSEKAHLRTRVGKDGMDYKGYNIAVHEFGHNVEQTITLHDVDYYMLNGVPNTAFTEAMAFLFQKRDLDLLGIKNDDANKEYLLALDNFWSAYEIMGVSLLDQNVWKWLYENPEADASQLKEAVIRISKEIWNKYYADVFGVNDQTILAIYSHMIDYPLYLSAYPVGHLIEFQVDKSTKGQNFADVIYKDLIQGRIVPQLWMKGAVGKEISVDETINAAEEALNNIK